MVFVPWLPDPSPFPANPAAPDIPFSFPLWVPGSSSAQRSSNRKSGVSKRTGNTGWGGTESRNVHAVMPTPDLPRGEPGGMDVQVSLGGISPKECGHSSTSASESCMALRKPHVQGYQSVNYWPSSKVFQHECLGVISQRAKYPKSLFLQENRDHCRSLVQMGQKVQGHIQQEIDSNISKIF